MRAVRGLLVMLVSISAFSQDTIGKRAYEEFQIKVFIGAGVAFNSDYAINNYLEKNGIVPIQPVHANITTGLHFFNQHVDIDLGYELFVNGESNDQTKMRFIANGIKLRAHYEIFVSKKTNVGAGFNLGYNNSRLSLYRKGHSVDFEEGTGIQGNQLTLFLEKGVIGPSVSVRMKDSGRNGQSFKITAAYEFGITQKPWESQFFTLENKITEPQFRQFLINAIFDL